MGIEWCLDLIGAAMVVLISLIAFIVIFTKGPSLKISDQKDMLLLHYLLSLMLISGLIGQLLTRDLFNLYVFLEVTSLSAYGLVGSGKGKGVWAGYRYLLIGTIGASFYLLGIGYLYATTGTLNMTDVAARLLLTDNPPLIMTAFILIFCGLAVKMGLFPFHAWLPEAHTHAPDSVSAIISSIMVKVPIIAFIRIFCFVFTYTTVQKYFPLYQIMCVLGSISILVASVRAFMQTDVKRILAYSTVSSVGLIVLGIGLNSRIALAGSLMHIVSHAFMKSCLFLIAGYAKKCYGVRNIFQYGKLRNSHPFIHAGFIFSIMSMIGVPPLCGFFSKWYILLGAVKTGNIFYAIIIVISSLLKALFFFKIVEQVYLTEKPLTKPTESHYPFAQIFGFFSITLLFLGIISPWIFSQLNIYLGSIGQ